MALFPKIFLKNITGKHGNLYSQHGKTQTDVCIYMYMCTLSNFNTKIGYSWHSFGTREESALLWSFVFGVSAKPDALNDLEDCRSTDDKNEEC